MKGDILCSPRSNIKESDCIRSIDPEKPVKLCTEDDTDIEPMTIVDMFKSIAEKYPNNPAMMYKCNEANQWKPITYRDYRAKVEHLSKVFIQLGLEEHHSVAVLAYNCPEWFVAALAAIHAHGIIVGVYTTNSAEAIFQILDVARANIIVVDDATQLEKINAIRDRLPLLKAVIQLNAPFESPIFDESCYYYKWSDLQHLNVDDVEDEYINRLDKVVVNECCAIIFTSGTTGKPKGVMLHHDNILFACRSTISFLPHPNFGKEVFISYLPLSHVAALMLELFIVICYGGCTWFADRNALKGTLVDTLRDARPTRFLGVPRVFEKMYESIKKIGGQSGMLKRHVVTWGKNITLQYHMNDAKNKQKSAVSHWRYKFVRYFLMSKVKNSLGLDRCLTLASGSAPLSIEVKTFFLSLDMMITDAFGMSETSAPHLVVPSDGILNLNSVGIPLPGCSVEILNPDEDGQGELCLRGRNIFMGYVGLAKETKETIDDERFLHSGDLACIDCDGYVTITGRLKELIITAGGENIAPYPIELAVKTELPCVSNALLVGDRRKFLSILLTLKTEINSEDMSPTDSLSSDTLQWLSLSNVSYTSLSEIINAGPCPKVLDAIQKGLDRVNDNAISNAQRIQRFVLLPSDFSIATAELGPTLKVRRSFVTDKYKHLIDDLYAN